MCVDIDSLTYFPEKLHEFINIYDLIVVYMSEDKYPCFTIKKGIFENNYFKNCFSEILINECYYLIDQEIPGYVLIEYNAKGKTGKYINI